MKRSELEHIIRAAGAITEQDELVVIGSQAILGSHPDAPTRCLVSMEADIYPLKKPAFADMIDGAIGEGSQFHEEFGYYAQGVGPETAVLPAGWEERLVRIQNQNTRQFAGLCLEIHDLAISKYVAGRTKDIGFNHALAEARLLRATTLIQRLDATIVTDEMRIIIASRIERHFATAK